MQKNELPYAPQRAILPPMSDREEDLNAFNSWDCFGATLMLGVTPGIIHFATTTPHDLPGTIGICLVGVIISVVVLAVSLITRWRFLSKLINWAGMALTGIFVLQMALFWSGSCTDEESRELSPEAAQHLQAAPAATH